jgi:hypothetical protein
MVRRALFLEKVAPEWDAVRQVAATDPAPALIKAGGPALVAFLAERKRARERMAELEPQVYPPDEDPA